MQHRHITTIFRIIFSISLFLLCCVATAGELNKADIVEQYTRPIGMAVRQCSYQRGEYWENCRKTCMAAFKSLKSGSPDQLAIKKCFADRDKAKGIQSTLPMRGYKWMPNVEGTYVRRFPRNQFRIESDRKDWVDFCNSTANIPTFPRTITIGTKVLLKKVQYNPKSIGGAPCIVGEVEVLK